MNIDTEQEDIEPCSPVAGPATFNGRLDLASYSYSPKLAAKSSPNSLPARRITRTTEPTPILSTPKKRKLTSLTPSPSPRKKANFPSSYAPPSTYAHLPELRDILAPNLLCVFIGLNPGVTTATTGHAYAHPSNLFWKLLHSSHLTPRRCHPSEDGCLPRLFGLGNTNIVARPTRNGSELSKAEMDASVQTLEGKIRLWRPEAVCVVGKSVWESIWRVRHGRAIGKGGFGYG
ncbi:uracil-DNA glycosylase-like protein, partial [Calycina marina]